jgi:hypothetical protein
MKKLSFVLFLLFAAVSMQAQFQSVTISGGYSWADVEAGDYIVEDPDIAGTGWRINGLYEYNPNGGKIAYGFSAGYISVTGEYTRQNEKISVTAGSFPMYFAPKYMFGKDKFKGFVKGAIGMQFANFEYDGGINATANDVGFYGGGGGGILFFLKENVFLNFEYEIAYLSNSFYRDGLMQSAMGGVGFKF